MHNKICNALSYALIIFATTTATAGLAGDFQNLIVSEDKNLEQDFLFVPIDDTVGRRITLLQMPPIQLNFKFDSFRTFWITSSSDWMNFWKKNSRNTNPAPEISINWKSESLLAIFWASEDRIVRIPAFLGAEELTSETDPAAKQLRFLFSLNTPCVGIITDQSPVQFLVIDQKQIAQTDGILVRADETRTLGCH